VTICAVPRDGALRVAVGDDGPAYVRAGEARHRLAPGSGRHEVDARTGERIACIQ